MALENDDLVDSRACSCHGRHVGRTRHGEMGGGEMPAQRVQQGERVDQLSNVVGDEADNALGNFLGGHGLVMT